MYPSIHHGAFGSFESLCSGFLDTRLGVDLLGLTVVLCLIVGGIPALLSGSCAPPHSRQQCPRGPVPPHPRRRLLSVFRFCLFYTTANPMGVKPENF